MGNSPIVNRINALLAEKGISKQDFYRNCGITSASYSLWNTGKTSPRMKNLEIIASYLGTTTDYLLTGLGEKEKAPTLEGEHIDEPEIRAIQRAAKNMTPGDKKRMLAMLQLAFEEAFKDDESGRS